VGTVAVVVLFATLCYAILRVALRTKDCFVRLAAAGVFVWIATQTVVNIGAVLGVLPIIGPAAAAGVLRRLGADPDDDRAGDDVVLRPPEAGAAEALAARRRRTPWRRLLGRREG
jgi:cell division protein FtsW